MTITVYDLIACLRTLAERVAWHDTLTDIRSLPERPVIA